MSGQGPSNVPETQAWLVAQVAALLDVPAAEVDARAELSSLGLDSAAGVELVGRIETRFGGQLSPTVVWDHPTIERLAAHLAGRR